MKEWEPALLLKNTVASDNRSDLYTTFWAQDRDSIIHRHVTLFAVRQATVTATNLNICPNGLCQ